MPLVEPSRNGTIRREKLELCGGAGVGKTTAALSIALWAHRSGDARKFHFLDFDDSLGDLLMDPAYAELDNIVEYPASMTWEEWLEAAEKATASAQRGDWIIGDMIGRGWRVVQEWEAREARGTTRKESLLTAAKAGKTGWDLTRETNWPVVNAAWDEFIKPLLLASPAHLFFTTEVQDIGSEAQRKESPDVTAARREFGRFIPVGQKHLPYQMRSVLRLDRMARGRVLYTLKDRAREEMQATDMKDFFLDYCCKVAGWKYEDPA